MVVVVVESARGFSASPANLLRAGPSVALPQLFDRWFVLAEHGRAGEAGFPEDVQASRLCLPVVHMSGKCRRLFEKFEPALIYSREFGRASVFS